MENMILLSLILIPFVSALVGFFVGRKNENLRDKINIFSCGLTLLLTIIIYNDFKFPMSLEISGVMGTGLSLKLDYFRFVFVFATALIWFLIMIYSTQYLIKYKNRNRYYTFFMLTLSSTLGVFLSQNILNVFTFFEIMSFTSYILVIHDEDKYAHEAGVSYLSMAVFGGLITLMGIFLLYDYTNTLDISLAGFRLEGLGNTKYIIGSLIMVGFAVKASLFPFHTWLPKAHPAAPTPASAILSGILIKVGVFGIFIVMVELLHGDLFVSKILLYLGLTNMLLGGFLALFQRNIKRILAYSSMSQAGYIISAIALYGILDRDNLALFSALTYIFNHSIFKVLLFMGAGIVYMILHDLSINKIRGFGYNKNILKTVFLIAFLAIIGSPMTNGFISKTLLHETFYEAHKHTHSFYMTVAEIVFFLSSSFTFAYLTKIFVALFIEHDKDKFKGQYKEEVRKRALFTMVVLGGFIIYIGMNPNFIINYAYNINFPGKEIDMHVFDHLYSFASYKSFLKISFSGLIIYLFVIRKFLLKGDTYINPTLKLLSLEKIYFGLAKSMYQISAILFSKVDKFVLKIVNTIYKSIKFAQNDVSGKKDIIKNMKLLDKQIIENNISNYNQKKEQVRESAINMVEGTQKMYNRMEGISSSIFLMGFVLVFVLITFML